MKKITTIIISLIALLLVGIYFLQMPTLSKSVAGQKKELLVFCGITMIQPMSEIAAIIESQENVKISLIKGGSGNLLKSIKFNNAGDLYLPGSESYIKQAKAVGLIVESVHVGFNKATMMVQKGNPLAIKKDLKELKDKNYTVVIGNPDSGSIGKETKKILASAGIYDDVLKNIHEMTTDSKRLVEVLKNKEADLVINWYATSVWDQNSKHIDTLSIDDKFAQKKRLVLGLLSSSRYPKIARKFMAYAASQEGQRIFDKYGLFSIEI
jgi:molybdate transport system substrate-binding protein